MISLPQGLNLRLCAMASLAQVTPLVIRAPTTGQLRSTNLSESHGASTSTQNVV